MSTASRWPVEQRQREVIGGSTVLVNGESMMAACLFDERLRESKAGVTALGCQHGIVRPAREFICKTLNQRCSRLLPSFPYPEATLR